MTPEFDYKIIEGQPSDCQMKLNQWKHKYKIIIKSMTSRNNQIVILLARVPLHKDTMSEDL